MKQILFLVAFVLLMGGRVFSQERPYGFVLRLVNENARTADQFSWMVGVDAGIQLEAKTEIGFFASMAPLGYYPAGYDDRDEYRNYLEMGGVYLRMPWGEAQLFQPFFQIKVGYGNLSIGEDAETYFTDHGFYIVQPSVGLSYEINSLWSLSMDLHYCHGGPLDLYVYKYGSISGAGLSLALAYKIF